LWVVLEQIEQHETVDIGEPKIERDRTRLELARHREGARASGRDDALQRRVMRSVEEDAGKGRIVLDDQHERILAQIVPVVADIEAGGKRRGDNRAAVVVAGSDAAGRETRRRLDLQRDIEAEGRAFAWLRAHLQLTAEQPRN